MSYAMSAALQEAVYQHLLSDPDVSAAIGSDIYDAIPQGEVPTTYVTIGPEEVRDRSDKSGAGAEHKFLISVVTEATGFLGAKSVAACIADALDGADLTMSRGRLVGLWFERAKADRTGKAGRTRRIDLRFSARVEDN